MLNAPREKARKIDPRATKWRTEYSDIVDLAFKDAKKINDLQQKTIYDPEEVKYIMQYVPMVSDVETLSRDLRIKDEKKNGKTRMQINL